VIAAVPIGASVRRGQIIGYVADQLDRCGPPGSCLHWGVRSAIGYLDPMALIGAPVVRLLPIWSGGGPVSAAAAQGPEAESPAAVPTATSGAAVAVSTAGRHSGLRRVAAAVTGVGGLAGLAGAASVSVRRRLGKRVR
jgi:murein DD-endopeptidase MepM/ murein hydrolase activator NlpD